MTSDPTPVQKIAELAKGIDFAMLTTVDETGAFVSRPMAQQDTDFDGDLWFLSSRDSRKVAHITARPRVGRIEPALTARVGEAGRAGVQPPRGYDPSCTS